jgi:hypothetical protein
VQYHRFDFYVELFDEKTKTLHDQIRSKSILESCLNLDSNSSRNELESSIFSQTQSMKTAEHDQAKRSRAADVTIEKFSIHQENRRVYRKNLELSADNYKRSRVVSDTQSIRKVFLK